MGLKIDRTVEGETIRITVGGDVDLYTSPELRDAIIGAAPGSDGRLEVDLSGVDYMDSSGVATLVEGFKSARENSRPFVLINPSASVMKVLELARLDAVFEIDRSS